MKLARQCNLYSESCLSNTFSTSFFNITGLKCWNMSKWGVCVWSKSPTLCIAGSFLCVNQTRQTCLSPTHYIYPRGSNENSIPSYSHPALSTVLLLPLCSVYDSLIFVFLCLHLIDRTGSSLISICVFVLKQMQWLCDIITWRVSSLVTVTIQECWCKNIFSLYLL